MTLRRLVKANLIAGMLPGLAAPLLWPVTILMSGQQIVWTIYPVAALSIALFALIGGLLGCMLIGVPCLLLLERLRLHRPGIAAAVGAVLGILLFLMFGPDQAEVRIARNWPLAVFLSTLAAMCGYAASRLAYSGATTTPQAASR